MRCKLGRCLMLCGLVCLLCAAGLLLHNRTDDRQAGETARTTMVAIRSHIGRTAAPTPTEMTTTEIDGLEYIGYLSLPTVNRELPILAQLTMPGLQSAPGRYQGATFTDDLVLGAHNFDFHFGPIRHLAPGDDVFFTDMDGIVSHYQVTDTEILQPQQVEEMIHSEADLTLFTCTYGGASRVTVRCARVYQ